MRFPRRLAPHPSVGAGSPAPTDVLAILRLLGLYAHLIDDGQYDRLSEVFSDDAVMRSAIEGRSFVGLREITAHLRGRTDPPVGHHMSDAVITASTDGRVDVRSKGLVVLDRSRVHSIVYTDFVLPTPAGWRITERTIDEPRDTRLGLLPER